MTKDLLLAGAGIGLFLIGLQVLTEGLRGLAGNALRRLLAGYTTSPASGAAAGAAATAIVQSSGATEVTTVGFVGAGILTFPRALGIIFGANLGTTITGWLVAVVGFTLHLAAFVVPLVLVGALAHLFGRGRVANAGWAVAGFGLLFMGIGTLQDALTAIDAQALFAALPGGSLAGRLELVALGLALTLATQSTSAGIAMAMAALAAGAITFAQAAALAVGMDVGGAATALIAAVSGSTDMRRTGYANVVYNLMTGALAFVLLWPLDWAAPMLAVDPHRAQLLLAAFHTGFNLVGLLVMLPLTPRFADLITRLVGERGTPLVTNLDNRLLADPRSATDAAAAALTAIEADLVDQILAGLGPAHAVPDRRARLDRADAALRAAHDFIDGIHTDPQQADARDRRGAVVHALDHLYRLRHRCGQRRRMEILPDDARLRRLAAILLGVLSRAPGPDAPAAREARLRRLQDLMLRQYHAYRDRAAAEAEAPSGSVDTLDRLDSARWLHRTAYHLWRTAVHLGRVRQAALADRQAATAILKVAEEEDRLV